MERKKYDKRLDPFFKRAQEFRSSKKFVKPKVAKGAFGQIRKFVPAEPVNQSPPDPKKMRILRNKRRNLRNKIRNKLN